MGKSTTSLMIHHLLIRLCDNYCYDHSLHSTVVTTSGLNIPSIPGVLQPQPAQFRTKAHLEARLHGAGPLGAYQRDGVISRDALHEHHHAHDHQARAAEALGGASIIIIVVIRKPQAAARL
jgi:hypothetical protein